MPELPEVEHVAKELDRLISRRTIDAAELRRPRLAPANPPGDFAARLARTRINGVGRRGKHILIGLDTGSTLIVHLRMTGRFFLLDHDDDDPKFTHAALFFEDGTRLVFQDQRHFGLMKIVDTNELFQAKELSKLAPEPFSAEFSVPYLQRVLLASARPIKEVLLDQTKVCGVGNIYASEAMFIAGVSPRRRAKNVPRTKVGPLYESIKAVLTEAIEAQSLILPDPKIVGEGVYGNSDPSWRVYDREGEPCPNCGAPIKRIRQAGRSTYFCSQCQR